MKKSQNDNSSVEKNSQENKSHGPSTRTGIWRLMTIVSCLQNGEVDGGSVNCSNLMKYLEIDRSTVMRDLMFLRDRLGVEFEWDASGNGYVLMGECPHFPCMELGFIDKMLFQFIENALHDVSDTELGAELCKSFDRLMSIFTGKNSKKGWGVPISLETSGSEKVSEFKTFNVVMRAIDSGRLLKISYLEKDFTDPISLVVNPQTIVFKNSHWFLDSLDAATGKPILISLEGVTHVSVGDLPAKNSPSGHSASDFHMHLLCHQSIFESRWSNNGSPLKAA